MQGMAAGNWLMGFEPIGEDHMLIAEGSIKVDRFVQEAPMPPGLDARGQSRAQ